MKLQWSDSLRGAVAVFAIVAGIAPLRADAVELLSELGGPIYVETLADPTYAADAHRQRDGDLGAGVDGRHHRLA
jgi:hypothetical protein